MQMREGIFGVSSCAALILLTFSAGAGEKVRFAPASAESFQTRPERSVRESIELRPALDLSPPPTAAVPMAAPAPAAVSTRRSREDQADQQNWIFRDVRSAGGVRKALGVDTAEANLPSANERDSVAVIQEYFSRQQSRTATGGAPQNPLGELPGMGMSGNSGIGSFATGTTGFAETGGQKSGNLFGESSFRNTLNSENTAVRRYFRDLYANPNSPSLGFEASSSQSSGQPATFPGVVRPPAEPDATRPPSFQDLANRAALIDSLTPTATLSPQFGDPRLTPPPPTRQDVPTVNNGNLFEKSNGRIEIPGRRF